MDARARHDETWATDLVRRAFLGFFVALFHPYQSFLLAHDAKADGAAAPAAAAEATPTDAAAKPSSGPALGAAPGSAPGAAPGAAPGSAPGGAAAGLRRSPASDPPPLRSSASLLQIATSRHNLSIGGGGLPSAGLRSPAVSALAMMTPGLSEDLLVRALAPLPPHKPRKPILTRARDGAWGAGTVLV